VSTAVNVDARVKHATVTDDLITFHLVDGRVISVPLVWSWRLSDATPAQRDNYEIIGDGQGVHWPDVDEDLSVEGMFNGVPPPDRRSSLLRRLPYALTRPAAQGFFADC